MSLHRAESTALHNLLIALMVVAPSVSRCQAPTYTGCNGQPATGQLQLWLTSASPDAGLVQVNGVDTRRPNMPFDWD